MKLLGPIFHTYVNSILVKGVKPLIFLQVGLHQEFKSSFGMSTKNISFNEPNNLLIKGTSFHYMENVPNSKVINDTNSKQKDFGKHCNNKALQFKSNTAPNATMEVGSLQKKYSHQTRKQQQSNRLQKIWYFAKL